MRRERSWWFVGIVGLAVPLALGSGPAAAATKVGAPYDLNGDGKADLVVGAPRLDHGSVDSAGGVAVFPGSGDLYPQGGRVITQSSKDVAGGSEDGDEFGATTASADFDRDGYADLAVGIPGESFTGTTAAGAVTVLYGGPKGLTGVRSKQISEPSGKEAYANFGSALAAGDLNGDGYPDLAVGAPSDDEDTGAATDHPATGTVTVLLGGPGGLTTSGSRLLRGVRGTTDQDYLFGSSLAVGDVDGVAPADLVVLSRGAIDDDDGDEYAGSAAFCSGGQGGPSGCRRLLHSGDIQNNHAVVVGDVQGDGRSEIVVGVPSASVLSDVGHLELLTLTGSGAQTSAHADSLGAHDLGLPGASNADEQGADDFGWSLALGRVDSDHYADLAVGAPDEVVGEERGGRAFLVHGGTRGLARTGNGTYDQDTPGVPGGSEDGDRFGAAVALLDRDGDGRLDLTVGAPGEDDDEGRVTTLRGTGYSFTATGSRAIVLRDADNTNQNPYDAQFGTVVNG